MSDYDDIINLPHHTSRRHPPMSMYQRAAQFAPFAALTGHDDAIRETARQTDQKVLLSDLDRGVLDARMAIVLKDLSSMPQVVLTYFVEDGRKDGGHYKTVEGRVWKWDEYNRSIIMRDGTKIALDDIVAIEGKFFDN